MYVVPSWIESHCVVPDGFSKGEPLSLYRYQIEWFINFYRVRGDMEFDPRHPILGPAFVFSRGILVGPQKLGKGPTIAAHVCVEGTGPALFAGWAGRDDGYACSEHGCGCGWEYPYDAGEPMGMLWPTPLIQITAASEEQTENIYDALRPMIEAGPLADVIPRTGEEFIRLAGGGRIDTVTSSARSRLGQRVTFVPQDEVGTYTRKNKMTKLADTQYRGLAGMGGRAALTTNAWDPSENSVGQEQYESSALDIYRQFVQPPKGLKYEKPGDRKKIHQIVYPKDTLRENGGHIDLDGIESEAVKLLERDPPQAKRFFGNIIVRGHGKAVDPARWRELAVRQEVAPKTHIGLGFDGSISKDCTVLRGCTRDGYSFIVGAWVRPQKAPREWLIPRSEVHEAVASAFDRYQVGRMYCDPAKWWSEVDEWSRLYGEKKVLALPTNSDSRFAPEVDRWLTEIQGGTHTHDGDELTNEHVLAAHLRKTKIAADEDDGRTLYALEKGDDGRHIDGAIADVLALAAARSMPEDEEPSEPRFYAFADFDEEEDA